MKKDFWFIDHHYGMVIDNGGWSINLHQFIRGAWGIRIYDFIAFRWERRNWNEKSWNMMESLNKTSAISKDIEVAEGE